MLFPRVEVARHTSTGALACAETYPCVGVTQSTMERAHHGVLPPRTRTLMLLLASTSSSIAR